MLGCGRCPEPELLIHSSQKINLALASFDFLQKVKKKYKMTLFHIGGDGKHFITQALDSTEAFINDVTHILTILNNNSPLYHLLPKPYAMLS